MDEKFYKHFKSHNDKDYAIANHACSCMLRAVVFPAELYHASIPPRRGARICLQLQFKRVKGHIYPHKYARTYNAGVVMSDKDELYLFLKHQVEYMLDMVIKNYGTKDHVSMKHVEPITWLDLVDPKTSKKLEENELSKNFLEPVEKSLNALKKDNKEGGSFAALLIDEFGLTISTLQAARIVHASMCCAFDNHSDVGPRTCNNDSVTVHLHLFRTDNFLPGDTSGGPWKINNALINNKYSDEIFSKDLSIRGTSGVVKGFLGGREMVYCKNKKRSFRSSQILSTFLH